MEKILEKISSYNIFNYLFPGAVFATIAQHLGILSVPSKELVAQLIWYYFVGLVISRVGSLFIEPLLKASRFVTYSDYPSYLRAAAADPKMEVILEASNSYRTLAAASLLLVVGLLCTYGAKHFGISPDWQERAGIVGLAIMFLFSFRKQSGFVSKRVAHFGTLPPP